MIVAGDDDVVVAAAAPPQLLDSDELRRVCASICTVSLANDLRPLVATPLASAVRTLMVVGSSHRRGAVAQLSALVAALHAREARRRRRRVAERVLATTTRWSRCCTRSPRARWSTTTRRWCATPWRSSSPCSRRSSRARPLGAYWSRQFFFECDFCRVARLPFVAEAQANSSPAAVDPRDCAPLALHALAALCNARPVENADVRENQDQIEADPTSILNYSPTGECC
jgi:hypothetical protein